MARLMLRKISATSGGSWDQANCPCHWSIFLQGRTSSRLILVCNTTPIAIFQYTTPKRVQVVSVYWSTAVYGEQLIISMRNKTQVIGNTIFILEPRRVQKALDICSMSTSSPRVPPWHGNHFSWAGF